MIQLRLQQGYCIDTSALIDLHTNHYPPDIFPGLWKDLEILVDQGILIAPDEVFHEICVKDDGLAKWGKSNKKMFIPLDVDQSQEVSRKCRAWTVVTSERPNNSPVSQRYRTYARALM